MLAYCVHGLFISRGCNNIFFNIALIIILLSVLDVIACLSGPCANGGTCTMSATNQANYLCLCPAEVTGANCESKKFPRISLHCIRLVLFFYSNETFLYGKGDRMFIEFNRPYTFMFLYFYITS
jgi:EGF-like domain